MAFHVVSQVCKLMTKKNIPLIGSNVLIMGITFKENCPDLRNSRVIDVIEKLKNYDSILLAFTHYLAIEN